MKRSRVLAFASIVVAVVGGAATAATAHVEIDPAEAPKGATVPLTFHVPAELPSADTVKIDIKFPDDHPIATATPSPHDGGWTAQVIMNGNAVSEVVWSGGTIKPGIEDEFVLTVGPLPSDTDSLTFPTVQTYSDGTEVSWIQESVPGQPEPEHPLPELKLTDAGASTTASTGSSTGSSSGSSASAPTSTAPVSAAKDSGSNLGIVLAVLVAVAIIGAGITMLVRRRRPS